MDPAKPSWKEALRALARRRERELEVHPSPAKLVAYLDGELSAEEQERLRDHLAVCRPCAGLVRDLGALSDLEVPEEAARHLEEDVEAGWESLQDRIRGQQPKELRREPWPLLRLKPLLPFALALAASLGGTVLGTALMAHTFVRIHARAVLLLLGLTGCAGGLGWAVPVGVLVGEGRQVVEQVDGAESHSYRIHLHEGDFLQAVVDQRGVDLQVVWRDPAGRLVLASDGLYGRLGSEEISAIAQQTGEHRLQVVKSDRIDPSGEYRLEIAEVRPSTPEDRIRFEAASLLFRAEELRRNGGPTAALRTYEQALDRWQAARDAAQQAETLYRIGWMHAEMGRFGQALAFYRRVEPVWLGTIGEGYLLNRMGLVHTALGEPDAALAHFERARRLGARTRLREIEAYACQNLALEYRRRGRFQQALAHLHRAEQILSGLGDPRVEVLLAGHLGQLYLQLGRADQALASFRHALRLAELVERPEVAFEARMSMSFAHTYLKQYDAAREIADELVASTGGLTPGVLNLRGLIELEQERLTAARGWYEKALRIAREQGDAGMAAEATANLGYIYGMAGDGARSLQCFEASERYYRRRGDLGAVQLGRFGRALVLRHLGHLTEALAAVETSLELVEAMRSDPWSADLRASFLARRHSVYATRTEILMDLHQREPGAGHDARALEASETARARTLLEAVAARDVDLAVEVDAELLRRERSLQDRLRSGEVNLMRLTAEGSDPSGRAAAQDAELQELRQSLQAVRESIRFRHPRFADLVRPDPLTIAEIRQRVLDDTTLLLVYALGEKRSFVWLLGRELLLSHEVPAAADIERLARAAYADFSRPVRRGQGAEFSPAMAELSDRILGPVAEHFGSKRLLVLPDGALHYIPFAALPDPREPHSPRPLLLQSEVVVLPSASVLDVIRRQAAGRERPPMDVAVLADPVFTADDPRIPAAFRERSTRARPATFDAALRSARSLGIERLERLAHSRQEARNILALVPPPRRFAALDFAANRDAATSPMLARYRIVHFATHGLFNPRFPDLSGIVLTTVDRQGRPQDGFLHASEIYSLDLPVDLVVLSACKTALGEDVRGEGLVGLTRGFFHAGASRLVVSLWSVDDRATEALMGHFYFALLKDRLPPGAALRRAQRSLLEEDEWSAPYHWAAFVLQGEWR